MSLSKDIFERRTTTGSSPFSFLDGGFVSIIVKTLRNTNLVASRCCKMKKTPLPVDIRRSKETRKTDFALSFQCGKPSKKWSEYKVQRHIVRSM